VREELGRARPPSRWFWALPVGAATQTTGYGWRVLEGERGGAVLMLVLSSLLLATATATMLVSPRARLVLTDDALLLERRWRPLRVPRADVVDVDGDVRGRPDWSEYAVLTVRAADGTDRTVKVGAGLDVHARVLVPRLRAWAGVGDAPPATDQMTPGP
jgi:hypothetical protein